MAKEHNIYKQIVLGFLFLLIATLPAVGVYYLQNKKLADLKMKHQIEIKVEASEAYKFGCIGAVYTSYPEITNIAETHPEYDQRIDDCRTQSKSYLN